MRFPASGSRVRGRTTTLLWPLLSPTARVLVSLRPMWLSTPTTTVPLLSRVARPRRFRWLSSTSEGESIRGWRQGTGFRFIEWNKLWYTSLLFAFQGFLKGNSTNEWSWCTLHTITTHRRTNYSSSYIGWYFYAGLSNMTFHAGTFGLRPPNDNQGEELVDLNHWHQPEAFYDCITAGTNYVINQNSANFSI